MSGPLGLDPETLNSCVQCGLCLPHCPTWRSTGEEARSPRGRIDAMRSVEQGAEPVDAGFAEVIDSCVGCMACETACPSSVEYGRLLEGTRNVLAGTGATVPAWQRRALSLLERPALLRTGVRMTALAQRLAAALTAQPASLANLPALPIRQEPLRSTGSDVVLLTGCVMDASMRDVHASAVRLLGAAGFGVQVQSDTVADGRCCGALAAHRGLAAMAEGQLGRLAEGLPSGVPVLSDSAGCCAAIHEAAARRGADPLVRDLARRTEDVGAFLFRHVERLPPPPPGPLPVVALAVPCHMRNVLGADVADAVAGLLGRYCDVRSTADDDLCCGAGGSHSVLRPHEASMIRDRKVEALSHTGATVVASANPGCIMSLRSGGVAVSHPVQIIDGVLSGAPVRSGSGSRTTGEGR